MNFCDRPSLPIHYSSSTVCSTVCPFGSVNTSPGTAGVPSGLKYWNPTNSSPRITGRYFVPSGSVIVPSGSTICPVWSSNAWETPSLTQTPPSSVYSINSESKLVVTSIMPSSSIRKLFFQSYCIHIDRSFRRPEHLSSFRYELPTKKRRTIEPSFPS